MENVPPSYDTAIARDPWVIIAPFVPSTDLCALTRVNRKFHHVFAPCLWGNPASHFGTEGDRVFVALTRFKRALKRVRLSVRQLTHTLHLPPAQAELYDGPHPEWLRDVLDQLPNLQSLIVSSLPFFDHLALLGLRTCSNDQQSTLGKFYHTTSLRLLIAARCQNATSQGLAEAIPHFPNLAFLDLSNTLAARDRTVLSKLQNLPLLQVLKLRNLHLRDTDVSCLAEAIGLRVRSLDLQSNDLTDRGIDTLLGLCFGTDNTGQEVSGRPRSVSNLAVEDWPAGFVRPDPSIMDEFKDESYDERFVQRLTSQLVSRLPFEDLPQSGISHLYIANNVTVTVEGLAALIRAKSLHVLDAGSIGAAKAIERPGSDDSSNTFSGGRIQTPGVESLVRILDQCAQNMTYLRVHSDVITKDAPPKDENPPLAVCELGANVARVELHAPAPRIHELDATPPPLYELDSQEIMIPSVSAPAIGKRPELSGHEKRDSNIRRGSIFAPEIVEPEDDNLNIAPVLTATGLYFAAQRMNGINSPTSVYNEDSKENDDLRIATIEKQRHELRLHSAKNLCGLAPGMMSNLRTIVLTQVPCFEKNLNIVTKLIRFIEICASEAELASLQARLKDGPSSKPVHIQSQHHRKEARKIFPLQRIVLEMTDSTNLSPHSAKSSKFMSRTKSSTEDADSEALWSASESDFTFFDDDEECGLPSSETNTNVPIASLSEKIMMPTDSSKLGKLPTLQQTAQKNAHIDVVQELARFRRDRKAAYEKALRDGARYVDGYWHGEVKVVRGPSPSGKIDYYGNHFEKGIYR